MVEQGEVKMDERNDEKELKSNYLKTNIMGDEGQLDLEIAKELLFVADKTKEFAGTMANLNSNNFTGGLIHPDFLPQVKKIMNKHFSSKR